MLKVGFHKTVISPDYPVILGGYAARNGPSVGVHDDLFAKVCSINDSGTRTMIITCDIVNIMHDHYMIFKDYCAEKHDIKHLIIAATHTHSGPETRKSYTPSDINESWYKKMLTTLKASIDFAINNEVPTSIKHSKTHVPEVGKNRRKGKTVVDDELNLLVFENLDKEVIGLFLNYACHCTILDSSNYLVSADYPQYIYQRLEKKFPKATIMFSNGACGDINIGYSADDSALGIDMKDIRSFENAKTKADFITDAVLSMMPKAKNLDTAVKGHKIDMKYPVKGDLPSTEFLTTRMEDLKKRIPLSEDPVEKQKLEIQYVYDTCLLSSIKEFNVANKESIETDCVLIEIGNVLLMSFPGELFCEIGLQLKKILSDKANLILIGYSNGHYGYFPTAKAHEVGGYESETSVNDSSFEQYIIGELEEFKSEL